MWIAVYARVQSRRDPYFWHGENGIPAFSPKGSRKARLWQVPCSIKRHRHSSGSGFDGSILANREVADWTLNSDAKFTARAPDLGEAICFLFHSPEHRSVARKWVLRGILKRFLHQLNTSKRELLPLAHKNSCAKRPPRQRLRCAPGMFNSLEVQVLYPT